MRLQQFSSPSCNNVFSRRLPIKMAILIFETAVRNKLNQSSRLLSHDIRHLPTLLLISILSSIETMWTSYSGFLFFIRNTNSRTLWIRSRTSLLVVLSTWDMRSKRLYIRDSKTIIHYCFSCFLIQSGAIFQVQYKWNEKQRGEFQT